MIYDLVIDDKEIILPEELTLGIYQEIQKYPERYKNPLQLISLFTGISVMDLKNQDRETIELLEAVIGSRFTIPSVDKIILTFKYDGVEYGLENDWSKLAFGGWIDFEVYSSENIYDNLHRIMAILYRPINTYDKKDPKKYTLVPYKSEEIEPRSLIMKEVPVKYWLSSALFFLTLVEIYTSNIRSSLEQAMKTEMKAKEGLKRLPKWAQKIASPDSTSPFFTNSLKKILQRFQQ